MKKFLLIAFFILYICVTASVVLLWIIVNEQHKVLVDHKRNIEGIVDNQKLLVDLMETLVKHEKEVR